MLDLTKGVSLDLKKADGVTTLSKVRVGLSWDIVDSRKAYDLDVAVVAPNKSAVAYFGNKTAIAGVTLSDDNLTGEGDGDDEFAILDANITTDGDYTIVVSIHEAAARGQSMSNVKNGKATIYDAETDEVIATFNLGEAAEGTTGCVVAVIKDEGSKYTLTTKGDFVSGDLNAIVNSL